MVKMMNNILIVGGAGYIGGITTDIFLKHNYKVTIYSNLLYEDSYRKYHKNLEFVYGDIRDREKLLIELNKSDAVIWLAAIVGDGACQINPELTYEINTESVKWLCENYNKRILFPSTCSVYGVQKEEGLLTEESETNPISIYAESKLKAEKYLLDHKDSLIFRLGTVFGVGDQFSRIRMDLVVNTMVAKVFNHNKIKVYGGEQFRPLISVNDIGNLFYKNIISSHNGIFNIAKENIKMIDLANKIKNIFPNCELEIEDMPFQDTRNYKVSNNKMRNILKFKPRFTIGDEIQKLWYLISTRRIKDVNNYKFINEKYLKEIL